MGTTEQIAVRMPSGWREKVKAEAAKERRSMNSEILAAIEAAMRSKGVHLDTTAQK